MAPFAFTTQLLTTLKYHKKTSKEEVASHHHQGCQSNNNQASATRKAKVQVKYGAIQSGMRSDASSRADRPGRPRLFDNVIVASF